MMMRVFIPALLLLISTSLWAGPKSQNEKICSRTACKNIQVHCKKGKVRIFDATGQLRIKTNKRMVDIANLPDGWYLVKTRNGAQMIQKVSELPTASL